MSDRRRFGRFELRPTERQLIVDGMPSTLGSRAFDLLLALHERRDRTVPKSELMDLVWPGLVVEENNLQVQVSALRKLLGAQAIATIPGRGYRFVLVADTEQPSQKLASGALQPLAPDQLAALPAAPESFFGRDDDLAALCRLLSEHRMVTVLGAGGIGKTTLALAAAHEQAIAGATVAWVELAPLADPALIPVAMAQALQLPLGPGDARAALVRSMHPLQALLVLDNAEHLVDAVAEIAQALLGAAPGVQLLVTSQAPLKIDAEWLFRVGSLAVAEPGTPVDRALGYGAVALFDARARAADRRFVLDPQNVNLVIDLCQRLDGLALAIRLAAARLPLFGLAGLHARLAEQLKLVAGGIRGAPARQQTLRATHDWSFHLLAPVEQAVFRRLGVFVGGFTLSSAAAVARDETHDEWAAIEALAALVERSLVVTDERPDPRYHLLQSAREYALERLEEAGETQALRTRHAQRLLALMEQSIADDQAGMSDREWLARHGCEFDDLRAAIDWSEVHDPPMAVALVGASLNLFPMLGLTHQAWEYTEQLEHRVVDATALAAARFWTLRSLVLQIKAPLDSNDAALKSVERFRASGNRLGLLRALAFVITTTVRTSPAESKRELLNELTEIERSEGHAFMRIHRLAAAAVLASEEKRFAESRALFTCAVDMARAAGRDRQCANLLAWLADLDKDAGELDAAVAHSREAVALYRARGVSNVEHGLRALLTPLLEVGDIAEARRVLAELIELSRRSGWYEFSVLPARLATFAMLDGRFESAAQLLGLADHRVLAGLDTDPWTNVLREPVRTELTVRLAPDELQRLMAQGAALDEPAACALALDSAGGSPVTASKP
jgi:predicted ATPase/DNA-binding winged helix-turn-helix (wHTH) protein